ncbi:hypothetical protein B194_3524 [Serratia plymuthica A30]|nr:hypothetical protein B194_3524 [Serratia plymuthica A30]
MLLICYCLIQFVIFIFQCFSLDNSLFWLFYGNKKRIVTNYFIIN